jgi:hypothetical protein
MPHFLTWVLQALTKYPTRTLFKEFDHPQSFPSWVSVSYESFLHDLERSAAYWGQALSVHGLNQNDVVGLWYNIPLIYCFTTELNDSPGLPGSSTQT